jgi:predicted nucleic acid-binding protein
VDIALAEGLNVIWKHANLLKDIDSKETNVAVEDLTKLYDGLAITSTREIKEQTMQIAITQNITIYDALYIATAQKLNATLYTADQKLYSTANKTTKAKLLKNI